ncbi:NUDIX domain-containing protein [Celeribacter sp.]|uniref:NUDIX domain-containing protein n=1 Tax=Celeribacter sp. TaxID=1890673 RepID=UPI003A9282FB
MRKYGDPQKSGVRYTRRPGAYALLPLDGKLLVTYQGGSQNEFQLPGGGIDSGETAIAALHREVWEETGWRIAQPRFVGRFRRYAYLPEYDMWAEKICLIYTARPVRKLCDPIEPNHTAHWITPESAATGLGNAGDRAFVASLI